MTPLRQKSTLGRWLLGGLLLAGAIASEAFIRTSVRSPTAFDLSPAKAKQKPRSALTEVNQNGENERGRHSTKKQGSSQVPPTSDQVDELQALHPTDRIAFVTRALQQASRDGPDAVVSEGIRFCDLDPSYSLEYGRALIATLAASRDYPAALRFVLAEESDGDLGENGNKWLNTLFIQWAKDNPRQATQAADTVVSAGLRGEALQAIAAGWEKVDPAGLADSVLERPPSSDRERMLEVTLGSWAEDDPVAAKGWIAQHKVPRP